MPEVPLTATIFRWKKKTKQNVLACQVLLHFIQTRQRNTEPVHTAGPDKKKHLSGEECLFCPFIVKVELIHFPLASGPRCPECSSTVTPAETWTEAAETAVLLEEQEVGLPVVVNL